MKKFLTMIMGIMVLAGGMAVAGAEPTELKTYWDNGLVFKSEDKAFKIAFTGRVQADWMFQDADDDLEAAFGEFEDGTEFRRTEIGIKATIYDNIGISAQFGYATGTIEMTDVYVSLEGEIVSVMVGHFNEPFGLEELTSNKYLTFMERGLPTIFDPSRNMGIMLYNTLFDKEMTWALGVFKDTDAQGKDEGGNYNVTGRLTGLPYHEGSDLIHLGASASMRNPDGDVVSFSQRPEAHLSYKLVKSGDIVADSETRLGLEAAGVYGPFSLQSEYIMTKVDASEVSDPTLSGFYVYGSYFLTGESRPYNSSEGAFSRVKPEANFLGEENGMGAWEIALRYSSLDMDDVDGGKLNDVTAALNWYLNPNVRVMLDYVYADLDEVGSANIAEARFQFDF